MRFKTALLSLAFLMGTFATPTIVSAGIAAKLPLTLRETPQSVTVVPRSKSCRWVCLPR